MKECPGDHAQVTREILTYLSGLPDAEDTLDGIMRQRLPESPTNGQSTFMKEVAVCLVSQGRVPSGVRHESAVVC